MAALSVHTKLALGPRRARPSLAPGPHQLRPGGCRAGGGSRGARGSRRCAPPPSRQPCGRTGICFATVQRRPRVALAVMWQETCQGPQRRRVRDGPPGGAPRCATLCPGCSCLGPSARPRCPEACPSTLAAAESLSRRRGQRSKAEVERLVAEGGAPQRASPLPARSGTARVFPGAGGALPATGRSGRGSRSPPPLRGQFQERS